MAKTTHVWRAALGLAIATVTAAGCTPAAAGGPGPTISPTATATVPEGTTPPATTPPEGTATPTATAVPNSGTDFPGQHQYHEGETLDYLYDATTGAYATTPAQNGAVPRITTLNTLDEIRTHVHITIVSSGGKLMKKVDLPDISFRELRAADLDPTKSPVPFTPMRQLVKNLPAVVTNTFPIGGDAVVAENLGSIFGGASDLRLNDLIDIFSWTGVTSDLPTGLHLGQGVTRPPADVTLSGQTFHNGAGYFVYSRVDQTDGTNQAFLTEQNPGNYFGSLGIDTNYQLGYHTPLSGPYEGIVSDGQLEETIFAAPFGSTRTASVRQVTITLQTPTVHTLLPS